MKEGEADGDGIGKDEQKREENKNEKVDCCLSDGSFLLATAVPAFAGVPVTHATPYVGPIEDTDLLMQRIHTGVDERSEAVRIATTVFAKVSEGENTPMRIIGTTTQLVSTEYLRDGSRIERYATTAVASTFTETNYEVENGVYVYAMVNYTARVVDGVFVECRLDNTKHKVMHPSAVTASNLQMTNKIDNGLEILHSNSRSIASPSNNTWYSLSSPSSAYFNLNRKFQGTTTVAASNGASPYVLCEVNLHSAP